MSRATAEYMAAKAADIQTKSAAAFDVAIGKDPDKARGMLKLWFVPDFKPTFYDEQSRYASESSNISGLDDIELLDPSYSSAIGEPGGQEGRYPLRMIDIDTKNLVDHPSIGVQGQYCILSHSWKGREVNYKYVLDAKPKALNRDFAAAGTHVTGGDRGAASAAQENDIDTMKHQCLLDITEQEDRIKALVQSNDILSVLGLSDTSNVVEELLSRRVDMQVLEKGHDGRGGLQKAKNQLAAALAAREYEKMEDEVFNRLLGDIGLEDDKVKEVINGQGDETQLRQSTADVIEAEENLNEENKKQSEEAEKVAFFERHGQIREAVEELIGCLQRSKSATKIQRAIERSIEIFDRNPFPRTEKRFLWIDSCCINKADDGECARSISAMGEWYKNAEFCLVHLDTPRDVAQDSLEDWQVLKSTKLPLSPNITSYADILASRPEWSTRAWTLQELVMSKTTFYVNSNWKPLSRPVETIGPWYYLCSFVSLYNAVDTHNPYSAVFNDRGAMGLLADYVNNSGIQHGLKPLEPNNDAISMAQKLINILDTFDLRIPREIDMATARSWIAQSVYMAVSSLTAPNSSSASGARRSLDNLLETLQPYLSPGDYSRAQCARYAINILLKYLVRLIADPVLDDRSYIAAFGNVPNLELWRTGLARSHFSTHKVMSLLCGRDATVVTDRAYSLMGILGVRFPTFPAEGLTKALSRLLDEVVISSNDVSVFNWTGKQYGSPIRGRSLYPLSPEAYRVDGDEARKKQKDRRLAELLQIERYEVMSDFLAISGILSDVILLAKDQQQKHTPLHWVTEIIRVVKKGKFSQLKPHITNIGKIIKYVQSTFESKLTAAAPVAVSPPKPESPGVEKVASSSNNSPFPSPLGSFPSQFKAPSLPVDMPSFKPPKFGRKKTEPEVPQPTASSPSPFGRGIGGFKAPSMKGFGKKVFETPATVDTLISEPKLASQASPPTTPSAATSDTSTHRLDGEVLSYIRCIRITDEDNKAEKIGGTEVASEPELPPELGKFLADIPAREFSKPHIKSEAIDTMISPNPIIVKNSGIEGSFDIQRVVVSMPQPEKLRRQIRNAVSPAQKITGWCTISTGFAMVVVSFSCPKHILEKELDVVQAVEVKVLAQSQDGNTDGDSYEDENGDDNEATGKEKSRTTKNRGMDRLKSRMNVAVPDLKKDGSDMDDPDFEHVREEGAKVSRMIKFVQEPDLTAVAGEWVLARFSGVPGAAWFLCYLELGGSGREFYGHRVATDEINFHNASPEIGLMKYWEYYMMQKKHKLCSIVQKLLQSKSWANLKTEVGQSLIDRVAKETLGVSQDDAESDDEDGKGGLTSTLKELGGMALTVTGAGLGEKFYQWRAERLEKNLSAEVLKKFPSHMQAALESLDDNKDLMPSMFHSATKIHMF
ncbi:hypothetical protein F4779DRAFT_439241 [Xylariaceae sp. FL0662B]|nr:hypothetical protein F4779DRAFT_439241 [Xylariaceae sp. FL0662B]